MDCKVSVSVRVRPKLENVHAHRTQEERYALECCTRLSDTTICLSEQKGKDTKSHVFCFDNVYDKDNTQEDVYEDTALELVDAALQGHFATILAYGQTGSGKTFTVLGAVRSNPLGDDILIPETGLLLRAFKDLIAFRDKQRKKVHMTFTLSVIEIYCDDTRDLLGDNADAKLKVVLHDVNMYIPDLRTCEIKTIADVMKWYKVAMSRRVSRATQCNDQSSRSHAIFTIDIFQQEITAENPTPVPLPELLAAKDAAMQSTQGQYAGLYTLNFPMPKPGPAVVFSKIVLADLAGSEKAKKSESKGQAFEEMVKINASLTSLGNVVHSLYTQAKHIPYRDSKLTILLRSAFASSNSRVALVANVSPTNITFEETLSTLYFANKVKQMKVAANSALDIKLENEYLMTLKYSEEIASDMRIAAELHDFRPRIRATPSCGLVVAPFFTSKRAGSMTPQVKAQREAGIAKCAQTWSRQVQQLQEDRRKRRDKELQDIFKQHKASEVEAFHRLVKERHEKIALEDRDMEENRRGTAEDEKEYKEEIQKTEKLDYAAQEAKLVQRQKELTAKLSEACARLQTLETENKGKIAAFRKENESVEKEWEDFEEQCHRRDKRFNEDKRFFEACTSHRRAQSDYYAFKGSNVKLFESTLKLKIQSERTEALLWMRGVVLDIVHKSCVKSDITTGRPSGASATKADGGPMAGSLTRSNSIVSAQSFQRRRGTSVYDSPTIMSDIIAYLQAGSTVFKYGKSGIPRYRHMFISPRLQANKQVEYVIQWESSNNVTEADRAAGKGIEVSMIKDIILGQTTKVFKRARERCVDDSQHTNYYLSFSILYIKKQSQRSLNIIVEAVPEFEAWVLGLSHLARKTPVWGEAMQVDPKEALQLSEPEFTMCRLSHVRPAVYLQIKDQLKNKRRELTRGELRTLLPVDFFRASAMWEMLVKQGVLSETASTLMPPPSASRSASRSTTPVAPPTPVSK
eukprot:PhM_4_TR13963/c0_g1_i1/m.91760/K10394/KIF3A; kinesin family member 3A